MTTDLPATSTTSMLRWWRDWLLMSAAAVFVFSLVAAHLPARLMPIVIFPIGFAILCGVAIGKCAEIANDAVARTRRWLQWLCVVCLLLAGFAHLYWIVFNRYLDEAREAIAAQEDDRREREQIAAAISQQGHELDDAGMAGLLQPRPTPPTFIDYLRQRLVSDRLPAVIQSHPWPITIFALEIAIAVMLGAWFAVEGTASSGNLRERPMPEERVSKPQSR